MLRPFLLFSLVANALAGSRWLQNDGFAEGDEAGFQTGFVEGECWAVVFEPEASDYPFDLRTVRVLVGGDTSQETFDVSFYAMPGTDMSGTKTLMGSEAAAITGSNENYNDLPVVDLELELPQVESGNIAVSLCFSAHSGVPAIARDTDGTINKNLNWIYANSAGWLKASDAGVKGDWITRLCIDGSGVSGAGCDEADADTDSDSDTDTDTDTDNGDLSLLAITPTEADEGESVNLVLLGTGFTSDAEARIGGLPLTGQVVVNSETISGRSSSALPPGLHDVEVVQNGESSYLPSAFEVIAAGKCSTLPGQGGLGLALLGMLAWTLRRRD